MARPLATPPQAVPTDELLMRVMGDFDAMPSLRLTLAQATRLWGLDRPACEAVLHALVELEFLERDCWGQFVKTQPEPLSNIARCSWQVIQR